MIDSAALSWVLSIAFVAIAIYYGVRLFRVEGGRRPSKPDRISSAAHVAMSLGMVPMLWWWGVNVPVLPQLAVFGLAALWFLVLAASGSRMETCALHERRGPRGLRLYHVHHFLLMAAMVWMVVLMTMPTMSSMPPASAAPPPASPAMDHSMPVADGAMDHAMPAADSGMDHSMAGMDHGGSGATVMPGGHTMVMGDLPAAAVVLSVVLAAYFLILIPWWLREMIAARRDDRRARVCAPGCEPTDRERRGAGHVVLVEAAIHAVKCGGMGVMLLAMI